MGPPVEGIQLLPFFVIGHYQSAGTLATQSRSPTTGFAELMLVRHLRTQAMRWVIVDIFVGFTIDSITLVVSSANW
jgi:hypothetical protein